MSTVMVWLILALVLQLATAAAVTTARRNCSDTCADNQIPYPFGLGPSCSLPGFSLSCAVGKDNITHLVLGNTSVEVFPLSTHAVSASISYSVKMIPGVHDYSVGWKAPGRPFAIRSSDMSLFVVGCGVKASMFIGNSSFEVGNCVLVCEAAHILQKLTAGPCDELACGCCRIDIQVNLRAFTLNISRISDSARSDKVLAFISGDRDQIFRPIDALRSTLPTLPYTVLEWAIPYQPDCQRAMEDRATYACVSNRSKCEDSSIGGYVCYCLWDREGEEGNPYVRDGCPEYQDAPPQPLPSRPHPQATAGYDSIQPRSDCPTSCGNVSTPFPFGTELGCFAKPHMYLKCNPTEALPILQLTDRTLITGISIHDGVLYVQDISKETGDLLAGSDPARYALSEEWGIVTWSVDNTTCKDAKLDKGDYRCFSSHSDCADAIEDKHPGYRCKCSSGFEGNPYIIDGCTDVNECLQPDIYCNGICQNSLGSYACTSCPHGSDFNIVTRRCKPSTVILEPGVQGSTEAFDCNTLQSQDSEDQEEEALYANATQEEIFYEEPDLSGGVEGEDYKIVYGAEEEAEQ